MAFTSNWIKICFSLANENSLVLFLNFNSKIHRLLWFSQQIENITHVKGSFEYCCRCVFQIIVINASRMFHCKISDLKQFYFYLLFNFICEKTAYFLIETQLRITVSILCVFLQSINIIREKFNNFNHQKMKEKTK